MSRFGLHRFRVPEVWAGRRLDRYVSEGTGLDVSRTQVQKWIQDRYIRVDGEPAKPSQPVAAGQEVVVHVPPPRPSVLAAETMPLDVVYEDEDVLVLNKPRGLVVHPAPGHESGTLVNALLAYSDALSRVAGASRPGIVHRLDKDTTGLLLVAKTDDAHRALKARLKKRLIDRRYLAIVHGSPDPDEGMIDAPIGRHETDRKKMAVVPNGRNAWTRFQVLERLGRAFSLLELKLYTGRTHQIRVHLAYVGHPVVGDPLYGPRKPVNGLQGQALHAYRLSFRHPRTGERLTYIQPPPEDFLAVLHALREAHGSERTEVGEQLVEEILPLCEKGADS